MKKNFIFIFILAFSLLALKADEKLIPEHKDWLELVSPIITNMEKDVFLKLKTTQERDKFIRLFWKRRDPLPDTKENEFLKEYMKRVRFADMNFGHEAHRKGSQTERGHFYLLLGPPLERQIYATQSNIWPLELWFYKGEQKFGLPPFFYLIFYQRQGIGEYRLYSPGAEGPEMIVIPSMAQRALNRSSAYQILKNISGELAGASLSYLPGETPLGTSSFSSATIISSIYSLPEKKFSDAYARNFLYYKDYVETDYTHNYLENHFDVKIFMTDGQFYVHWTLEPTKVNFSSYQGKYYAAFQLILRVEDTAGNPVLEREEEIPLMITPENYKKHERQLFAFQDILPIIPGSYRLFILLQNKTAKDFTSFQADVSVPHVEGEPFLSNMLLYNERAELSENQKTKRKAFSFEGNQYMFNAQDYFLPQKELGVYCQVYNLEEKKEKSLLFEIFPLHSETAANNLKIPLEEALGQDGIGIDTGTLSLSAFEPGYYRAEISILDASGNKILKETENFVLLSEPHPVIPLSYSKIHNPFPNREHLFIIASEYFMTRKYEQAKQHLKQALKVKDESRTRILLAKTLYALHQFEDSLAVVIPVYQASQDREAAKIIAVDYEGLKNWSAALMYLEKLMEQAVEINVLNLAAKCYLELDQADKALPLIQKSLKLNPNQANVKEMEKKAKKQLEH